MGNEWIDYSLNYYKFPITENAVYRIDYNILDQVLPLNSISPDDIFIIGRGEEIPLYIKGDSDGSFDQGDYLEFYAMGNDGWLDTALYKGKNRQPNPYYSLINDSIYYFLSYDPNRNNKRFKEENSTDFSSYFNVGFVWKRHVSSFNSHYYDGEILASEGTDVEYVPTEGYMDQVVTAGNSRTHNIPSPNIYTSGPPLEFEIALSGQSNYGGINNGDHHLMIEFLGESIDTIFEGFKLLKIKKQLSPSTLSSNNSFKIGSINDLGVPSDRSALAYIELLYPHSLHMENKSYVEFLLDDNHSQNAYTFNPQGFNSGSSPILYDISNSRRIKLSNSLSGYKSVVPNGAGRKKMVLLADSSAKYISEMQTVTASGKFTNYAAMNMDSAYIMISHPSLMLSANNYASYRRNTGYNSVFVNIEELYDQFSYGIKKHPLAIRNFANMCLQSWPSPPHYLYLLGKSVSAKAHRKSIANYEKNLLPSMGNPASDNLFTSGLNGAGLETAIPTGRLAASSNQQIEAYLSKVMEYENAPREIWMKRSLHFAGGANGFEVDRFENYLKNYEQKYEDSIQGGNTYTFRKTQNVPIQTSLSDSIRTLVNEGVSLMTFFGHASSTGGFDVSIDAPEKFNNKGKYPVLLANSCFSGDIHQPAAQSTSEEFVLQPNKGVIAFIASVNLSLASFLNSYTTAFYKNSFGEGYGKSIAHNMAMSVKDIQNSSTNTALKSVCLEMSLHGDPALKMYSFEKPDYHIESSFLNFQPTDVSTEIDSFELNIQIWNTGRGTAKETTGKSTDSLLLEIKRKFPDSKDGDTSYMKMIPAVLFSSNLSLNIPVDVIKGIGSNTFVINLDPINQIDELSEFNNSAQKELIIRAGSIVPVHPYNFALYPQQGVELIASTAHAFEGSREYIFELDSNSSFSSPLKISHKIISPGGVIRWQPGLLNNMPDSTVYFWRVSRVPAIGEGYLWKQSSFQYISNNRGWAQDHFDQFKNNDYLFLKGNQSNRQFEFTEHAKELYVRTMSSPSISDLNDIKYQMDTDVRERSACSSIPAFVVAVLDSLSLESWETPYFGQNPDHQFGQANYDNYCGSNRQRPEKYFIFRTNNSLQMAALENMLENEIPNGNYIVIYNWFNIDYDLLRSQHPTLLQSIADLGVDSIVNIQNKQAFIVLAKKSLPDSSKLVMSDTLASALELRKTLWSSSSFGSMSSKLIGPSEAWDELKWDFRSLEANSQDSILVELYGRKNGQESLLRKFSNREKYFDLKQLNDINSYEYLSLKFNAMDEALQTAPQLLRWQLNHQPLPELALNPQKHFSKSKDSLMQGEVLNVSIAIENISHSDMDSLLISYKLMDAFHKITELEYERQSPLPADSTFISSISIPTQGLRGRNLLLIDVNPNQDQPEQFHFNNVAQLEFFVQSDRQNPLLDVTFDGRHIMNGELVSAQPEIKIQLEDENAFLALDDSSSIKLYLTEPGMNERLVEADGSNGESLLFLPAKLPDNKAMLIYRPVLTRDGIHQLRVQAEDRSGNESGKMDYRVEFEVVRKSSITHMVNYPNPFSTSTRFVFTLTGSQVPDNIQIQILTVTGKVVKEIYMEELGPIHIGNNISDYAWDGRDEFGDRLANGVYFYRVKTKMNGQSIEHRESASDKYFKEDFGKMYLLR